MLTREDVKKLLHNVGIKIERENSSGINIKCNICGDSKKNKNKARGWFLFSKDGGVVYYCHNEGESIGIKNYIKTYFPKEYGKFFKFNSENIKSIFSNKRKKEDVIIPDRKDISKIYSHTSISIVKETKNEKLEKIRKTIYKYLKSRKISEDKISELYYCLKDSKNYLNYKLKGRLIIPFYDNNGLVYAFQARSMNKSGAKYITIKENNPLKIYNYYNASLMDPVYIFEGPIDSWFVNNSIATAGSIGVDSEAFRLIKDRFPYRIWVFDNDETGYRQSIKFLDKGEKVSFWFKGLEDCKDINDVVIKYNLSKEELRSKIDSNLFKGMAGTVRFNFKL